MQWSPLSTILSTLALLPMATQPRETRGAQNLITRSHDFWQEGKLESLTVTEYRELPVFTLLNLLKDIIKCCKTSDRSIGFCLSGNKLDHWRWTTGITCDSCVVITDFDSLTSQYKNFDMMEDGLIKAMEMFWTRDGECDSCRIVNYRCPMNCPSA